MVIVHERRAESEADAGRDVADNVPRLHVADAYVAVVGVLWQPLLGVSPVEAIGVAPAGPIEWTTTDALHQIHLFVQNGVPSHITACMK